MTLTQLNLYRTYKAAEKIHYNFTKSGYYSIADEIADKMCELENQWVHYGYDLNDLLSADHYEQLVNDIETMTNTDKTDYLHYLQGYNEIG